MSVTSPADQYSSLPIAFSLSRINSTVRLESYESNVIQPHVRLIGALAAGCVIDHRNMRKIRDSRIFPKDGICHLLETKAAGVVCSMHLWRGGNIGCDCDAATPSSGVHNPRDSLQMQRCNHKAPSSAEM